MAYKQTIAPNLDNNTLVVKSGGVILKDWYGYCLAVARSAYGVGPKANTAWNAWLATGFKHADRSFPQGVYFPVWFSGAGGAGHVVICNGTKAWSAPITHKPYFDVWDSVAIVEAKYGVQCVGWSEDINGVRVVEPITGGSMALSTRADLDKVYWTVLERDRAGGGEDVYLGKDLGWVWTDVANSAERKQLIANREALLKSLNQQIVDLKAQLATVSAPVPAPAPSTDSANIKAIKDKLDAHFK